jgi:hypothetical protein
VKAESKPAKGGKAAGEPAKKKPAAKSKPEK